MWLVPLFVLSWITKINSNKWQMGPCSLQETIINVPPDYPHTIFVWIFIAWMTISKVSSILNVPFLTCPLDNTYTDSLQRTLVYIYDDWSRAWVANVRSQILRKKSTYPPTYEECNTSPLKLWKWIFWPLNFLKHDKSPPEAVLKNHSKSKKS
jgi:hypothetical protein